MKVAWLHVAPVKGLAIEARDHVELGLSGVDDDRRFCLVNEDGRMLNGKRLAAVTTIGAHFDPTARRLELRMASGARVAGTVRDGEGIVVTMYGGHEAPGHVVEGPWAAALSEQLGRPIRLVHFDGPGNGHDRASKAAGATLLSLASLERLAGEAGVEGVDARRFRMLIGIDGATAHEEDGWIGRRVRVGDAVVAPEGNVGRCRVTTLDPDTGKRDLETLDVLFGYRSGVPSTEALSFGVWARVERAGRVALGDEITLEDQP